MSNWRRVLGRHRIATVGRESVSKEGSVIGQLVVLLYSHLLLTTLIASALDPRESAATLGLGRAIVTVITVVVSRASRTAFHDAALALWGAAVGALAAHTS